MLSQNAATRFREREELLDFLLEVATVASETLELDQLLPRVGEFVNRVIPHDIFAILLYSERSKVLRIRYARGHRDEVVRNLVISLGEGVTGIAAATRQPVLVPDVHRDPRYLSVIDAVRSELAVPMTARGKLVGVIDIQSTRPAAFSDSDRAMLQLLASRVAASIDNARLYKRIERQSRISRTLLELSQEFSSTLLLDELLRKIAEAVARLIRYDSFSIYLVDQQHGVLRHRFSVRFDQRVTLENIPLGQGITGAAVNARRPIRVEDTAAEPRYIATHPEIRSEIAVPLIAQDRVVGVMDLESERIGYFTEEHQRTLSLLAPQIAASIENARLYEQLAEREERLEADLKAARKLQSVLLPSTPPKIAGLDIAFKLRPAREISGDLFEFFHHGPEYSLVAFGDSSGKGAAAALYGALVSGLLRTLGHRRRPPAELLKLLNDVLLERKIDAQYVTLLLMAWNSRACQFTLATAGAAPPLICRAGERIRLKLEGMPLGLLESRQYDEKLFEARSGDVLLLYSDGVTDQVNAKGEEFGTTRLFRILKKHCGLASKKILEAILAELDEFRGSAPLSDDQTLIAVKVL